MAGTAKKTVSKSEEVSVSRPKVQRGWFVLRAISGKEAKVKEILDAQIKNTDLGKHLFQVLIPTEKVLTVRSGKKVVKERNLYSGYVFVEAELTGETVATLTNTSNVIDFLRGRDRSSAPECLRERGTSNAWCDRRVQRKPGRGRQRLHRRRDRQGYRRTV